MHGVRVVCVRCGGCCSKVIWCVVSGVRVVRVCVRCGVCCSKGKESLKMIEFPWDEGL